MYRMEQPIQEAGPKDVPANVNPQPVNANPQPPVNANPQAVNANPQPENANPQPPVYVNPQPVNANPQPAVYVNPQEVYLSSQWKYVNPVSVSYYPAAGPTVTVITTQPGLVPMEVGHASGGM